MTSNRPTLIEVIFPRRYDGNPARAGVTRTIVQPEIDLFEATLSGEADEAGSAAKHPSKAASRASAAGRR